VHIETQLNEEGTSVIGDARIDRVRGLADSTEIRTVAEDAAITTRKVLVAQRAFLKSVAGPEADAALSFTEVDYEPFGPELIDESYTAFGRIGPSLDRIVMVIDELPIDAQITVQDGSEEVAVNLSPFAIAEYYATTGLEAVGGRIEAEPTRFVFRIEDGVLTGIVADGVHFHDGEALEVTATISYTPIPSFGVELPETDG
jgi:hypothetical protein